MTHCSIHNLDELATKDSYRGCNECFHVFQREADLLAAHNELLTAWANSVCIPFAKNGEEIESCPYCYHSF